MEIITFNEDYIKGIKFLLEKSTKQGINIRGIQWVPNVSKKLSEYNVCYAFWYNVWNQKRLNRLPLCNTWHDVMFCPNKCLFTWANTHEGQQFWSSVLGEMLGESVYTFADKSSAPNRPLRD